MAYSIGLERRDGGELRAAVAYLLQAEATGYTQAPTAALTLALLFRNDPEASVEAALRAEDDWEALSTGGATDAPTAHGGELPALGRSGGGGPVRRPVSAPALRGGVRVNVGSRVDDLRERVSRELVRKALQLLQLFAELPSGPALPFTVSLVVVRLHFGDAV